MNLKQLEYFICVAETLNFTKAANKCFISQTAMTQQIQALEKTVGVPLFIRDKHHVELTTPGKVYLVEARAILERSNAALRMARMASDGLTGRLRIGYVKGFGNEDFSAILRNFHSAYPNISVELVRDNMNPLMEELELGHFDLVFTVAPFHETEETTEHLYLRSYPVMAVLPVDHPLASRDYLTYQDLKGQEFIMMEPKNRPKDQMEESMLIHERSGFFPNVVAMEGDPESLLLMIASGMGISILPEYVVRFYHKSANLKILPMLKEDGNAETVDFRATWSKNNTNPALLRMLDLCFT